MFRKKKRKKHFSDYIVAAAITAIGLYTAAGLWRFRLRLPLAGSDSGLLK